mgnify:CR=1 FL=1
MKLVVNASTLVPPLTGIGRYSRYLFEQLLHREEIESFSAITPFKSLSREQLMQRITECDQVKTRSSKALSQQSMKQAVIQRLRQEPKAHSLKRLIEQGCATFHSNKYKNHVYWEPNYLLLPIDAPAVSTIYDLSHLTYPEHHPLARIKLLEANLEKSVSRSQKIVVISEFTRDEVIKEFGITAEKISIVPPAVSDAFREDYDALSLSVIRQRYQLPENFILSVCTLEPRKNLIGLTNAFCQLPSETRKSHPLVLVGGRGWKNEELDPILDKLERSGELIQLGYVAPQDLPLLFTAAKLLVYISLYEGYGMPVAEAMAAGTAVITSNKTSMPEVANGACVLVDPLDSQAVSGEIQRLLEDDALRNNNIQMALEKSSHYTWKNSADVLFKTLESLC